MPGRPLILGIMKHPLHIFVQGVFSYVSKKPTLRLCSDGIWVWTADWLLFGIYILLLVCWCGYYGPGNLVQWEKIIGINLSQLHIVW